jgi:hypothetical protein
MTDVVPMATTFILRTYVDSSLTSFSAWTNVSVDAMDLVTDPLIALTTGTPIDILLMKDPLTALTTGTPIVILLT